ncbi:maleate isomerase [Kribbella aluminosa]|uniref:Maleate isomerase n=1 Tax=Kribbella aluminosa TaxID=416017 RepID=A0ABS4UMK1_9ACTN|nr:hypothetical protein [Kribbella aluminosa]MBP2352882.1 maleate isomerase [Kribbella aluminosa]
MDLNGVITVGVLTPHATPGPDVELPDMAPGRVRVKLSRTSNEVPRRRGPDDARPTTVPTSADGVRAQARPTFDKAVSALMPAAEVLALDRAASALMPTADMLALDEAAAVVMPAADVLAVASTGCGYVLGYDEESALVKGLRDRWGVPAYATSLSAVSALRSRDINRVSLVHPPWFGHALNDLGAEYFRGQGFEVVDARLADLPDDPSRVQPEMVVEWVAQHLSPGAEAIFIGGNGLRAARAILPLERRTGRLVLEANQVLLWSILRNVRAPVQGFGMLFD